MVEENRRAARCADPRSTSRHFDHRGGFQRLLAQDERKHNILALRQTLRTLHQCRPCLSSSPRPRDTLYRFKHCPRWHVRNGSEKWLCTRQMGKIGQFHVGKTRGQPTFGWTNSGASIYLKQILITLSVPFWSSSCQIC